MNQQPNEPRQRPAGPGEEKHTSASDAFYGRPVTQGPSEASGNTRRAGAHSRGRADRLIPRRRWPRRLLIVANVAVASTLLAAGGVYGYVRYRIDSIRTIAAPHLTPSTGAASGTAENILLIGNQTRAGLNPAEIPAFGNPQSLSGSLSDVIMILHVDPAKNSASLLSIPRDLFVPMPPGSPVGAYQKIDAALNDGTKGPDNLIRAITDDLGIPINHYVELEFDGFQATVNALGGINMDFPEPVFDAYSGLNITTTGCFHLNGTQALALVRARHLQYDPPGNTAPRYRWPYDPNSDLARIDRDHTFLRVLLTTALSQGLGDPLKLNAFIGAIINQITVDPGLKNQILDLGPRFRHINPSSIPETTLPVVVVNSYHYRGYSMGDVDFPVQPADNQVIAAWDATSLPAPANPSNVEVLNMTGAGKLATTTAAALSAAGLPIGTIGDTAVPGEPTETLIRYNPADLSGALAVMQHLSGAVMLQQDTTLTNGTIVVDAGSMMTPASQTSQSINPASANPTPTTTPPTTPIPPATPGPSASLYGGRQPSPSADTLQPWDPRPCGKTG